MEALTHIYRTTNGAFLTILKVCKESGRPNAIPTVIPVSNRGAGVHTCQCLKTEHKPCRFSIQCVKVQSQGATSCRDMLHRASHTLRQQMVQALGHKKGHFRATNMRDK